MKILIVKSFTSLTSVGVLSRALAKRGHDVHLLVPGEHTDGAAIRAVGIRVHVMPFSPTLFGRAESVARLTRLLRAERFEIVHLNLARARLVGRLAATLAPESLRVVSTIRGLEARYERWTNRFDDATVVVSESVRRFLIERGIDATRIERIPNAIDLEALDRIPHDRHRLHRELGLPLETKLIGMVAFFRPHLLKGHRVFFDAAKLIADARPDVHFVLVGSNLSRHGFNKEYFERHAVEIGLEQRAHFLGERNDIPEIMSSLAANVLPSFREGCPMVVLESMARGIPTVASDIDSIREIVADGESGLLFPAGDSATLGKVLGSLLDDPVHARALAARGRERVESAFRSTTMAARYESLYRRLLDAKPVRARVWSGA